MECLPAMPEALGSVPSPSRRRRRKEEAEESSGGRGKGREKTVTSRSFLRSFWSTLLFFCTTPDPPEDYLSLYSRNKCQESLDATFLDSKSLCTFKIPGGESWFNVQQAQKID